MYQLIHAWPPDQITALEQAWTATHHRLQTKQYPWYMARGPMAATIQYLQEWQWDTHELMRWTRAENQFLLANEISINSPWWKVEQALHHEARQQRTRRLASRTNHQHLISGLDWHVCKKLRKKITANHKPILKTWVQGAVQFRDDTKTKQCPICHVPATPTWLFKRRKIQKREPMPAEWMERLTCPEEEPLWSTGWIPLEPQEHRQQAHPYQGHGSCQTLQPLAPHQYIGWAFTLDAAPSTYDARSQLWVFGLCDHTLSMGQLKRLGAITGIPTGDQTKARALVAGLVALARHTTTPVKVIVQLASVWEAWQTHHRRQPFPDLLEELTTSDRQRVTVLYVSRNTRAPDGQETSLSSADAREMLR